MIRNFHDKDTRALFNRQRVGRFASFEDTARKRLEKLNAANELRDLRNQGDRLEKLEKGRKGQYSIRINDKWRVCFDWNDGNAENVQIVNYHG